MCGIVGYVGEQKPAKFLVDKLRKLEYRGYDSSGIANLQNGEIFVCKAEGSINNLEKKLSDQTKVNCAIAHTRWATHGKPSEVNAHPHTSSSREWVIVHNGIIENYLKIKEEMKRPLKSDTDTEVVAELLDFSHANSIEKFIRVFDSLDGSFAILAINKNKKDQMFLAKRNSPLYLAKSDDGILVASDPICFVNFAKEYYIFNDNEFAEINGQDFSFYNKNSEKIEKNKATLDSSFEESDKCDFKHFMIKEIYEEPKALFRQVKTYKEMDVLGGLNPDFIKKFNHVSFIGCGTAYHAGLVGKKYFEKLLNIRASTEMASEFAYNTPIFADEKTLFIFISQSGETADTIKALKRAKEKGATCIALTNVAYSTLARFSDMVLPVCAGPEIAVASTKAYVCQLSALYMLASHLKNFVSDEKIDYFNDIENVAKKILNFNKDQIDSIAQKIMRENQAIFIGKDLDYITACEASLKLKEITYINACSYPSGELKHGFLALVEEGTPIFAFASNEEINEKTFNSASEAKSRGGVEFITTNANISGENVIKIEEENTLLMPLLSIVPMQYLAYEVSVLKGINPDQPRNLAKSVTVE